MSQRQSKYITTAAFPEPNYTQTPNDFFEMLPDMEHSEVNVTLVLIRETFGYHRTGCKMGLNKLAEAAGLSRNATKDGAEAAEKRGTFRRANPDSLGEAEWELVIGQPVTTHHSETMDGQPVTSDRSTSDSQVGVKESIKKKNKEVNTGASAKPATPPEIKLFREVTERYPNKINYENVVALIQGVSKRVGHECTAEDLRPFYAAWCANGWNKLNLAWLSYAEHGELPSAQKKNSYQNSTEPKAFDGIRKFLEAQNVNAS